MEFMLCCMVMLSSLCLQLFLGENESPLLDGIITV
jgi:hypothetical protein